MADRIVIEEYYLTVLVPRGLAEEDAEAIRRTLTDPTFEVRLRRAVRRVFRREASLTETEIHLGR